MKAYLAYSSVDRRYVKSVATGLGRINIVFDDKSFDPGFDFRILIREGLDKSNVLIFFVSQSSLKSSWVNFEIDEAEWRLITGQISGVISIIIDDETQISDLPEWMRRSLVHNIGHPRMAVLAIQNYLIKLTDGQCEPLFVGREDDLRNYSNMLIPNMEDPLPRVLVLTGLEGIGRRTFAQRVVQDYLALKIGPTYIVEETDTSEKLYLKLMSDITDFTDRRRVAEIIRIFQGMSDTEKGEEIARIIAKINEGNQIPVIIDKGPESTFLDNSVGLYKEEWLNVLRVICPHKGYHSLS